MFSINFSISALQDMLQLGKAAQSTLLMILEQSSGKYEVVLDRENLDAAEKQKIKNGLKELAEKNLVTKVAGTRSTYLIDDDRINFVYDTGTNSIFKSFKRAASKPKPYIPETIGNRPLKVLEPVKETTERLQQMQAHKKWKEDQDKKNAEVSTERFWQAMERKSKKYQYVEERYKTLPNSSTTLLIACTDFLDQMTSETYFYDVPNHKIVENQFRKKFQSSNLLYERQTSLSNETNLLIELDKIIRIVKIHLDNCVLNQSQTQSCNCVKNAEEKLDSLLSKNMPVAKLDSGSMREDVALKNHFSEWFRKNYPELLI